MSEVTEETLPSRQILIVDDDRDILDGLSTLLELLGWQVIQAASGREAIVSFGTNQPDIVLLDVGLPDLSGTEVLEQMKAYSEATPVVMMSGSSTIDVAVHAMRAGAEHFLLKPCDLETLEVTLTSAAKMIDARRELASLRRRDGESTPLVGMSPSMRAIKTLIERVADAPTPVLLQGESGTGKGVVARLIHDTSRRANAPYVDLNCAGLSRELLESELFGHERGAFTGAQTAKAGLFEIANGGTLFLDEIGELELTLQARLLKALEEKRFRRVGGVRDLRVDVRLIAATNRDLQREVAEGRFRRDLFYRLNVVKIDLPPLRERREDIPLLTELFVQRLSRDLRVPPPRISERATRRLASYHWPGNVRELRNVLERALLVSSGDTIHAEQLQLDAPDQPRSTALESEEDVRPLEAHIDDYLRRVVELTGGNMRRAAKLLDISPSTLYARLRK